jgi:hypothetical protein
MKQNAANPGYNLRKPGLLALAGEVCRGLGDRYCAVCCLRHLPVAISETTQIFFGDEGIFLEGAQRIVRGQVPYRDFFTYFTPGSYYWIALRFKLLGTSLFAGRVILLAYGGTLSLVLYMLARRTCSRRVAALAAWLFLVIDRLIGSSCRTTGIARAGAPRRKRPWLGFNRRGSALARDLVSVTCLFDQPKGFGLIVGFSLGFLIIAWRSPRAGICTDMLAAAAGISLPAITAYASQGGL